MEFAKALGDFSVSFKSVYSIIDSSIYRVWLFIIHYENASNYFDNLIPNLLAYAIFFQQWSTRIQELTDLGEQMELYYVYATIVKKLFLYDYTPDSLNDDLAPPDFFNALMAKPHLKAIIDEAEDPEKVSVFFEQYFSYG